MDDGPARGGNCLASADMNTALSGLAARAQRLRRALLVRRRSLAALAAAAATYVAVSSAMTPPADTVPVWTAAHDLAAGTVLSPGDLARVGFAPGSVPAHVVGSPRDVLGRTLAAPVGQGQPLAPDDVVRPGLAERYPGRVAVPVRITDPGVAALLRVGDRVALVAADPTDAAAGGRTLAGDAAVVALPAPIADVAGPGLPGRLVVFAVPTADYETIATVSASNYLTAVWLG